MRVVSVLILIILLSSCKMQHSGGATPLPQIDTIYVAKNHLYLGNIIPDTVLKQLRAYKVENHLLKVEIDKLKRDIQAIRKLQKIDSILKRHDEKIKSD